MAIVTLRYWAAAKEAAGTAEETVTASTLAEVLAAARGRARPEASEPGGTPADGDGGQDPRLRAILARSSFLIDGVPVGSRAPEAIALGDAAVIEVLPPFAGG
jgi:molybdopterin converting factor small subunit